MPIQSKTIMPAIQQTQLNLEFKIEFFRIQKIKAFEILIFKPFLFYLID